MSDIALACPQGRQFEKKTGGGAEFLTLDCHPIF